MDQGLAAVLGAAVGVLGTALTAVIASHHQWRLQQEHWRRQGRRETYAAFTTAVERAHDQAQEVAKLLDAEEPDTASATRHLGELRVHVDEADRLTSLLLFEGPDEVADFAGAVNSDLANHYEALQSWNRSMETGAETAPCKEAAGQALKAARLNGVMFINGAKKALS